MSMREGTPCPYCGGRIVHLYLTLWHCGRCLSVFSQESEELMPVLKGNGTPFQFSQTFVKRFRVLEALGELLKAKRKAEEALRSLEEEISRFVESLS